jgi:hypothetical protein
VWVAPITGSGRALTKAPKVLKRQLGADIGAPGNDRLLSFAGSLSIKDLQDDSVLLEESRVLTEL